MTKRALLILLSSCVGFASGGCFADDTSTEPPDAGARAGVAGAAARSGVSSGGTSGSAGRSSAGRGSAGAPADGGTSPDADDGGADDGAAPRAGRTSGGGTNGDTSEGGKSPRGGSSAHGGRSSQGGSSSHAGASAGGAAGEDGEAGDAAGDGAAGFDGSSGAAGTGGEPSNDRSEVAYVSTFLGGLRAFALSPQDGAPLELAGSPVHEGAHFYDADVDAIHRRLYAIDLDAQRIDLYRIAADGTLPAEPTLSKTVDFSPLMLALDPQGRFAYVAGSNETAVHVFTIDADSGELDALLDLQLAGAPAYVAPDPLGRFLYVTDAFEPGIDAYAVGTFARLEHAPFGKELVRSGAMVLRPDGAFLYSTGAGLNAFAVDGQSGALEALDGSPFSLDVDTDFFASNVATDSAGRFLYATSAFLTQHLRGFAIDPESGALDEMRGSPLTIAGFPYSVAVSPGAGHVYTGNDDGTVSVFALESDGGLKELDDSPFAAGGLQPELSFVGLP